MESKKLMRVVYQDKQKFIHLSGYADIVVWSEEPTPTLVALKFGGYPEVVRGLADAIYGGATIEIDVIDGEEPISLHSMPMRYRREIDHAGLYAEAMLVAEDEIQERSETKKEPEKDSNKKPDDLFGQDKIQQEIPAHTCYIFCRPGDEQEQFRAIDQKSFVPMIPKYQDYILSELKRRNIFQPLKVRSLYQELEAWKLCCEARDKNLVQVVEDGLAHGEITIPGAVYGPTKMDQVRSVTDYLNAFGVHIAEQIKKLFVPLFDPTREPVSSEVMEINEYVRSHAGYPLYDAQLAVAESIKRRLQHGKIGLIVAGCGTGKTKIGSVAVAAAAGISAHQTTRGIKRTFNVVLCPAHVTKKWIREIEESIPNTFAAVVRSITEFDQLYKLFERSTKNCFAIISKEKARDGYMRAPAVLYRRWNREGLQIDRDPPLHENSAAYFSTREHVFCCPDCGAVIMENVSKDGSSYLVPAGPLFFRKENRENHQCKVCGHALWSALNPDAWRRQTQWAKIGNFGYIYFGPKRSST